ncbi:hypothetical protein ACJMK2_031123 [Sinanodonta woodiana]|uniref:Uncharacterized protein n=1 Tax=Sinanodonta woodiana TaxID=1069815 RepID=A0ABD3WXV0_SINWO
MLSVTNKLLVAVVDLGTDDSGYGYSLRSDYEKDPMKVRIRTWNSGCFLSAKQPTCVLCDPAGQFNSFGYEAENKYTELSEEKAHYNWYFLRKFLNMISDKQVIQFCSNIMWCYQNKVKYKTYQNMLSLKQPI